MDLMHPANKWELIKRTVGFKMIGSIWRGNKNRREFIKATQGYVLATLKFAQKFGTCP